MIAPRTMSLSIEPASPSRLRRQGRLAEPFGRGRASQPVTSRWLVFLCITLLGYALLGKGWAYQGIPPFLFVGEIALLTGLWIVVSAGRFDGVLQSRTFFFMALLAAWGTMRTLPYLRTCGADALRDAVIWGYGIFAFIVYCYLVAEPTRLTKLIDYYRHFCWIFLPLVPIVWAICRFFGQSMPVWPWNDTPIIDFKGGDVLVHLSGILAFWCAGFAGKIPNWKALVLALCIASVGAYSRSGLLTLMLVYAYCFVLRPSQRVLWQIMGAALLAVLVLAITDFKMTIPGKEREVSFSQMIGNVSSIIGDEDDADLSGTKEWRLNWWTDIVNYTVYGPYRWTGKGFGINLADDDGYQGTQWEGKLRSPHNGHMTILARSGVPGIALWILVHLSWALTVMRAYVRSVILGNKRWASMFMFVGGAWLAFLINATFDVFLEGPMGGVWFWSIAGVGLAAVQIYQRNPEILADVPPMVKAA